LCFQIGSILLLFASIISTSFSTVVTICLLLLWTAKACAAPISATPLVGASPVRPPPDAPLLRPAPALSSGYESPSDRSVCIVPFCFTGALQKIPFTLADDRVLDAGPTLIAVLIGTLPHVGGGRVLAANLRCCVTPPITVRSGLGTFLTTDACEAGLSLTTLGYFFVTHISISVEMRRIK